MFFKKSICMKLNRQYFYDRMHRKLRKGRLWRYNGKSYDRVPFYSFWYWYAFIRLMTGRYTDGLTD